MDLTVRKAAPEDADDIYDLVKDVFCEFVAPGYSEEGIGTFLDYIRAENIIDSWRNDHFTLVAAVGDEMVGIVHIRDHEHISLMFVKREHHRRGVAGRLLGSVLEICRRERPGVAEITVNSSPYAVPVYRRLGFETAGDEETKNGICYVPMKKSLSKARRNRNRE